MKTKIKRYSRSVLSVLLSVCILMSCMAVGMITTAAETGNRVKGSWSESGSTWVEHNIEGSGGWSVTLAANSTYSFVFLKSDGTQCANNTTIAGTTEYNFNNNSSTSITLQTTVAGSYNFKYISSDSGSMKVKITFPADTTPTTWTAVGDSTQLFGTAWAPTATANDMTKSGTTWTKSWSNVYLNAGTIKYKVAKNHAWTTTYPSADATKKVDQAGYYNVSVKYYESNNNVEMTLTSAATYTLNVPPVENAVVKASYGTKSADEGGSITGLPAGAKVTISVTPDTGKTCTGITSTPAATITGSGKTWTLTMPSADVTDLDFTWSTVQPKPIYYNNGNTNYAMVSVKYTYNGETYSSTMTRLPNSNIWTIDVPGDLSQVTFVGDNGNNTGALTIPWTNANPKYTGGSDPANPATGGTWGNYTARANEVNVSSGTSITKGVKNGTLFAGITATMYDYYADGEVDSGATKWLSGINDTANSREYTTAANDWKWNSFTKLNSALSAYANAKGVTYPLYFGNLNVTSHIDNDPNKQLSMDGVGHSSSSIVNAYSGWNQLANGSIALSDVNSGAKNAVTGLTGTTLTGSNIHHYKSGATDQNGAVMAMFDEDFLSGENSQNKALATILRSSNFPVRKFTKGETITVSKLYLNPGNTTSDWPKDNAKFDAYFFNDSGFTQWVPFPDSGTSRGVDIPDQATKVIFVRRGSHRTDWNDVWNQTGNITLEKTGSSAKNVYTFSSWDANFTPSTDTSKAGYTTTGGYTYYEFDSTNGKDNAYFESINKPTSSSAGSATLEYYNNTNKVYSAKYGTATNNAGFFPFDKNHVNGTAHDLGFGMKLEIPFTLNAGGVLDDGTSPQTFDFSGDDDLWVFVDDKLVLDLGGEHNATTGTINFKDRTVTATNKQAIESGVTRNGNFNWFNNSNPNVVHKLTIYYMERGMFDSNLKFGFSFHAIPEQLQVDKKVRTYDVNSGFFIVNSTTGSGHVNDKGKEITRFEYTYQKEDAIEPFGITQQGTPKSSSAGVTYSIGTVSQTETPGNSLSYNLYNDQIAYFNGQYTPGTSVTLKETIPANSKYHYNQVFSLVDLANNEATYPSTEGEGSHAGEYTFTPPTNSGDELNDIRLRARFTNHMLTHDLILTKTTNNPSDTTSTFTFQTLFDFDGTYTAYPLYITVYNADGTKDDTAAEQLTADGKVTIKQGQTVQIKGVPENAKVKLLETDMSVSSGNHYEYDSTALAKGDGSTLTPTASDVANKSVEFTMPTSDVNATITNKKADPVFVSHSLLGTSTGDAYCYVTVDVKDSEDTVLQNYPKTQGVIKVDEQYLYPGSTNKLVITLDTTPIGGSQFEKFYEQITSTLRELAVQTGLIYSVTKDDNYNRAVVTIPVANLFNSQRQQLYTTLPFFSELTMPTKTLTVRKTVDQVVAGETSFTVKVEYYDTDNNTWVAYNDAGNKTDAEGKGTVTTSTPLVIDLTGYAATNKLRVTEILPSGTKYKTPTYSISGGTGTQDTSYTGDGIAFTSTSLQTPEVTVANHIKTKDVVLKKVVEGGNSGSTTFPIVVTYQSTDGSTVTTHTNETKNLANNETVTLSNVPINTTIAVSETAPSGYKLKSITPDGTVVTGTASPFTVNDATGTAMITVTNTMLHKVTLKKALSNSISGDNTDFTFNYSYTVDGTLKQGSHTLKNGATWDLPDLLPQGTVVTVTETNVSGYTKTGVSVTGITDSGNDTYTVGTTDGIIQINNSRNTHSFTIKKETDINNTSDEFKIKVYTKDTSASASADWVQYTAAIPTNKSGVTNRTADSDTGEYTITKDETLTITGLKANTQVKVVESGYGSPKYAFGSIAAAGTDSDFDNNISGEPRTATTTINADKGMVITNNVQTTSVTINKVVTGGVTGASVNFPLSVKVTNEKTGDTTTTYTCGSYTLTNGTANTNVKINGGQTLTIANVPIGATVEVEELSLTGLTPTFNFTSIDAADANITDEDKTGQKVSFKTKNASPAAVTVTNAIEKHNVTITKVLTNSSSTQAFPMAVTITGTTLTSWRYQIGDAAETTGALPTSMSIASGKSIIIYDIPEGASVTVTENVPTGFTCQSIVAKTNGTADIASVNNNNTLTFTTPADNANVTVTNIINNKTITVKKVTDSGEGSGFKVKVEYKPSNGSWTNYAGTGFTNGVVTLAHNGTASVSIPSDAQIRVTEDTTQMPSGYEFENITLNSAAATYANGYEFAGSTTDTITVHNTKLRNVNITKTTNVSTDSSSVFKIKVEKSTDNGNTWTTVTSLKKGNDTVTASSYNFDIKNDETLTLEGVRKGTMIRVTETDTTNSYTFSSTGSAVTNVTTDPTKDATDKTITFTVDQAADPTVTVDNDAVLKDFTINKTVDVAIGSGKSFKLRVQKKALGESTFTDFTDSSITNGIVRFVPGTPITISDQPVGTEFKIWEEFDTNDTALPEGYSFSSVTKSNMENGTGTVANGIVVKVANTTSAQSVNFNNTKSSQLIVTKSITDAPADKTFPITIQAVNGSTKTTLDSSKVKIYNASGTEITGADKTAKIIGDVYYLKNGETVKVDAQKNDKFFVNETLSGNDYLGYKRDSITVSGGTADDDGTGGKQITIGDGNATVTVNNSLITKPIKIKKLVDYTYAGETSFPIAIEYYDTTNNAWKPVSGAPTSITAGDTWTTVTLTGQPAVSEIRVTENLPANTKYDSTKTTIKVGSAAAENVSTKILGVPDNGTEVTINNFAKTAKVNVTKKLITGSTTSEFSIKVDYKRPGESNFTTKPYSVAPNETSTDLNLPIDTIVKVTEDAPTGAIAGFEYDSMTQKVGSADATDYTAGTEYTLTSTDDVLFTVNNKLKTFTVTIVKEVENEAGTPIADSTDFNISISNGGTASPGVINKTEDKTVVLNDVPYGTNVTVSESTLPRGYVLKDITGNGSVTADKTITVTNTKLPTYSVKVTKNVDGAVDDTKFRVRVQTNGTPYSYAVNGGTATTVNNGAAANVELAHNEYVIVSGLLEGEKLTVTETNDGAPNYSFDKFIVNGTDEAGTEKSYEYTVTNGNDQNIIVNNKEAAKYQYEVTYKYEGYSLTTYNNDGTPKEGPHRFFKASGELSAADWTGYFGAEGNQFVTDDKAKEFFGKTAPYEDDFMMDLEWETNKISNMVVDRTNKKVTFDVTATTNANRTVYVYFQLPYDVNANLVATGDSYKTTQQHEATTQYGNWVKKNDSFVSAPLELQGSDGKYYFQYWQIKSTTADRTGSHRYEGKVETDYKKCFYADFNMTMYQDSYVTAVYDKAKTDYNPAARSYEDTERGEARINFIENSRNQWNSDGAPDLSNANQKAAGDRIYSDFLLTFGYQDLQLNTLNTTNIKTGFVVEKVAKLDTGTLGYETKTQSVYHKPENYGSSEADAKEKVENMVKAGKTTDTGVDVKTGVTSSFIMNVNVDLKQLDNKNQMKYSLNMKNKEYETNAEPDDPYRNYVFRAYTYIKNGDTVVVSDPTYFTIYDMASIEPKV